jgi:hypothetical protein
MLGITTPDAIAFGMLVLAGLAAWRGVSQGDAAKKQALQSAPMVNIATGIVEANQFSDYMKAIDKLAIALTHHAAAMDRQHEVKHTNALERLAEKVDDALNARGEHPHRRR